jgi:hypothetical protein
MPEDNLIKSIGDRVTAIDKKFELVLSKKETIQDNNIEAINQLSAEITQKFSQNYIGNLPEMLIELEKKIDLFDINQNLIMVTQELNKFEEKLEGRIAEERRNLQNQLNQQIKKQQDEYVEKFDQLSTNIAQLEKLIISLRNAMTRNNDPERLKSLIENLENNLKQVLTETRKSSFFRKKVAK